LFAFGVLTMNRLRTHILSLPSLCAVSMTLGGCVTRYPHDWPQLTQAKAGDCPTVDGTYDELGIQADQLWVDKLQKQHLSQFLGAKADDSPSVVSVNLRLQPTELEVTETHADGRVSTRRIALRWQCTDSLLTVDSGIDGGLFQTGAAITGFGTGSTVLGRGIDGSLLVRTRSTMVGVALFIIPVGGVLQEWFRFREAPPSDSAAAAQNR
jgi:hypothetical protein